MAKTKHGLPETKGQFKLKGFVTGMQRDGAFNSKTTKTGREMNILRFGVKTAPESTSYVTIQGMQQDNVYFGKRLDNKKFDTKKVAWDDRFNDQGEGYNLIGISIGIEKDENGKNITDTYVDYDAAEEIYSKLKDETPVFVRGNIEFSSFKNQNDEITRNKRFTIGNLYGSANIDFENEDFTETSEFKQRIIFMAINKSDNKNDPHFIVEAKVVTYNSIEDTEFVIRNNALANQFRKSLKPYSAIDVWGKLSNKVETEEVEVTNVWGEEDSFKKTGNSYIQELVITGADPGTLDEETYSEEKIESAISKLKSQGQVDKNTTKSDKGEDSPWGENMKDIEDDDLPW